MCHSHSMINLMIHVMCLVGNEYGCCVMCICMDQYDACYAMCMMSIVAYDSHRFIRKLMYQYDVCCPL